MSGDTAAESGTTTSAETKSGRYTGIAGRRAARRLAAFTLVRRAGLQPHQARQAIRTLGGQQWLQEPAGAAKAGAAGSEAAAGTGRFAGEDGLESRATRHARQLMEKMDALYQVSRYGHMSYRALVGVVALLSVGAGYIVVFWTKVRKDVSRESAEVISATIQNKELQFGAQEFSKELIHQVLNDEKIARLVADWVMALLTKIQVEIGALVVKILNQEQVLEAVNRLADRLVAYLCSSPRIAEQVGRLLVDAICLQSSRDATAVWATDLVQRHDITCGFRDLVVTALQMDLVISEAQSLAMGVVHRILQDPETIQEAQRALMETLKDGQLRATAKESLWNIVVPWGGTKAPNKNQALKAIDDLMGLELSSEERHVLRGLQIRLRTGEPPVGKASVEQPSVHSQGAVHEPTARDAAELKAKENQEQAERKAREAQEAERELKDKAEQEETEQRLKEAAKRKTQAEAERKAKEEAERKAREEAERKAKELAERQAREEAERKAKEDEVEREARKEAERKSREEAERKAREEAERKAKELAERQAREEAERKAKEEVECKAREEAERKSREEAERKANDAAERKAREEAEREAKELAEVTAYLEVERKAKEEAEHQVWEEAESAAAEKGCLAGEVTEQMERNASKLRGSETSEEAVDRADLRAIHSQEELSSQAREQAAQLGWDASKQVPHEEQEHIANVRVEERVRQGTTPSQAGHQAPMEAEVQADRMAPVDIDNRAKIEHIARAETEHQAQEVQLAAPQKGLVPEEATQRQQSEREGSTGSATAGDHHKEEVETMSRGKGEAEQQDVHAQRIAERKSEHDGEHEAKVDEQKTVPSNGQDEPPAEPKPAETTSWFGRLYSSQTKSEAAKGNAEEPKPAETTSWFGGWFRRGG